MSAMAARAQEDAAPPSETPAAAAGPRPAPPLNVVNEDRPNDAGTGVIVKWELSPDDTVSAQPRIVLRYEIERREETRPDDGDEAGEPPKGPFNYERVGETTYQVNQFEDRNTELGGTYRYRVVAVNAAGVRSDAAEAAQSITTKMEYFDRRRAWFGIMLLLLSGTIVYFIGVARRGGSIWVRPIAGLEAVSEAVGRATEMGRSCLFVPGIQDINDIQTVAGITILARVAALTAEYDAKLWVPTSRSLVMTTARETVEAAYLAAGRPDAYREDDIYYLTDEQFGYVAGVTGEMLRDRPAACFYMGSFFAESLLFAETGNQIGAIQVAGTAQPSQLPFFVAACDYTLLGEEFFAASAYLSGEARQLGSLKGQDLGKLIGALLIVAGCAFATLHVVIPVDTVFAQAADYVANHILGQEGLWP
jgi:hypothetical protein